MAKWSLPDKLQPSLLDRLTDERPDREKESGSQAVLSERQYKEAVIRDLGWLLNSVSMESIMDLTAYPEVKHSVINYGMPDISGHTSSTVDPLILEKSITRAITEFEPRIIPNTLRIKVHSNPDEMSHNSLVFQIEGVVFGQPMSFPILLRSQLDLESGDFSIREDMG